MNFFNKLFIVITSFSGNFTYIETLWTVVKWSMKWPFFHKMGPNRNILFQTLHLFVTIYGLAWRSFNIRWCWSIWKSPITIHTTSSSNELKLNILCSMALPTSKSMKGSECTVRYLFLVENQCLFLATLFNINLKLVDKYP